jgi:hypothetical protein
MPLMIHYPGGEGTCGHKSISRPCAPYPVSRCTKNEGASGDVHENKGTRKFLAPMPGNKGGPMSEASGGRKWPDANFWLLDSLLAGISREVYENKGTGKFLAPNARKYTGGSGVRTLRQHEVPRH